MNYEDLLKKYIQHVGELEGMTFLHDGANGSSGIQFTDEEWKELQRLDELTK